MTGDDHIEHFEVALRNSRRIDRAKAIRQERQCSLQEAVAFEQREFEAAKGGPCPICRGTESCDHTKTERARGFEERQMPNLVRRLRDFRTWNSRQQHYEPLPICKEAALEILSLTEQIEALSSVNDELRQRIGLGEAENERLERMTTKLQAALHRISEWCPATQEMTLAHEMAQEADAALSRS